MAIEGDLYFSTLVSVSAGAAYDDLNDQYVRENEILEVTHVSVENETTGYTHLRIGVDERDNFRAHEEEKSPSAGEIYWTRSRLFVNEGARLKIRCTGCTSGDVIRVNIQGLLHRQE